MENMKTNETAKNSANTFRKACSHSCKRVLAQLAKAKASIVAEARETVKVQDHLLRLALNEAEALASQTLYPHLVFPALAEEKLRSVAAWERRQRLLGWRTRPLPF
jgi:hypothetical protein